MDQQTMDANLSSDPASALKNANLLLWREAVAKYQHPSVAKSTWQLVNTMGPSLLIWVAIYFLIQHQYSLWYVLPLAILNGGFVARLFIIFHDCGHGSFFKSKSVNSFFGVLTSIFFFTPYHHWRWEHSVHHSTSGLLDKRGTGDVWTMTVQEYLDSSRWKKFSYRIVRNPLVLFFVAPLVLFLLLERIPSKKAPQWIQYTVYLQNLLFAGVVILGCYLLGTSNYLFAQLVTLAVAASAGVWMFYVQHQFEGTYWAREPEWDYTTAALQGCSYYKLPRIFQWFSGNIGYHHIHHLSPKIPNYNLEACYEANPLFQKVTTLTLFSSLKSFTYRLWDEQQKKLVGYRHLREIRKQQKQLQPGTPGGSLFN